DERDDRSAKPLIWSAHDACRGHVGMREQHILDVARKNVEAAAQDQILLAVNDVQIAVVIQMTDVSRMQPAVPQCCCSLLLRVPVAGHDAWPANADLAVL